jgi:protein translocase SecG subunit
MYTFLLFLFVIVAFVLVVAILLQPDKKGLSGASVFGTSEGSAFGGRETMDFLHKLTIYLGVTFFVLALFIGFLSKTEFKGKDAAEESSSIIMERGKSTPGAGLPKMPATQESPATLPVAPAQNEPVEPAPAAPAGK